MVVIHYLCRQPLIWLTKPITLRHMARIVAWECKRTGTLFKSKKTFKKHLCQRAFARSVAMRKAARIQRLREEVWTMREMTSFAELEDWLNNNGDLLFKLAVATGGRGGRRIEKQTKFPYKLSCVRIKDMTIRMVTTTHCAPIGRKTTGWSKESPAVSYPAFHGNISFRQENFPGFSSDIFAGTPINTGSGGGGSILSYDLTLFFEDFPFMVDMMHQEGRLDPAIPYPPQVQPWLVPEAV